MVSVRKESEAGKEKSWLEALSFFEQMCYTT